MLKIGIVEDDLFEGKCISQALKILGYETFGPVRTYDQAVEMIQNENLDLLLIDINLDGLKDGIDLAKYIDEHYQLPYIFLTASCDKFQVERAKKVSPSSYLLKPFNKERLYANIEIAFSNFISKKDFDKPERDLNYKIKDALFVKDGYQYHKVLYNNILYLESEHVYVNLFTSDMKKYAIRTSMNQYLSNFDPLKFYRVHRSYVINLDHIQDINTSYVKVRGVDIPISRSCRVELLGMLRVS